MQIIYCSLFITVLSLHHGEIYPIELTVLFFANGFPLNSIILLSLTHSTFRWKAYGLRMLTATNKPHPPSVGWKVTHVIPSTHLNIGCRKDEHLLSKEKKHLVFSLKCLVNIQWLTSTSHQVPCQRNNSWQTMITDGSVFSKAILHLPNEHHTNISFTASPSPNQGLVHVLWFPWYVYYAPK